MSRAVLAEDRRLILPEEVMGEGGLKAGESYEIVLHDHGMFFIPLPPMSKLAGTLKLGDTNIEREGH